MPDKAGQALDQILTHLQRKECLAIEDTEHGLNAAAEAGIDCLVVPKRYVDAPRFFQSAGKFEGLAEIEGWVEKELLCQR